MRKTHIPVQGIQQFGVSLLVKVFFQSWHLFDQLIISPEQVIIPVITEEVGLS
jgi:hypothetical protein